MEKGDIYWANLSVPEGNEPGYRRPVLVVQSDLFNQSAIPTVLVAPLTTNLSLAKAPGNIKLETAETSLPKDSVVNVSGIISVNRSRLEEYVTSLDPSLLFLVDNGVRLIFDL